MNDQKIDENTRKTNANAKLRDFIAVPFIFIGLLFLTLAMITGSTYTINKVLKIDENTRKTNANMKLRDFIAMPFIFIGLLFLTLAMITGSTYTINKVLKSL